MAKDNRTILQRLTDVVIGTGNGAGNVRNTSNVANYNMQPISNNPVLYTFDNKEDRDRKLLQLKQQKLLSYQWKKIGYDSTMAELAGSTQVRVMYRDADLMDQWPEIHSALDIVSEESTVLKGGKMLNVYSKSERIKSILEDLFVNRLDVNVMLPMIVRDTCKYGNEFMFLNVDDSQGVIGWRRLNVFEMRRVENGLQNAYGGPVNASLYNLKPDEVKFIWEGHNDSMPFKNWQVAHFRLTKDTMYLPYGSSYLNGARRHWRMLSMMEDALFLYRLERSVERRIFKVNVGGIDEEDVPAFLQEFANNFKRAPIVDPQTGQIDLRKNFLDVSADYFIPVRPGQEGTSIDTLQGAQNQTSMDDMTYMQNKIFASLKIPKTYLNFTEAQGKGQNLALMDIRFSRSINYIQQAILMELTKIAIIHLYLLGFEDDLTNFTLTMNNPSNQIEMMELDNLTKRVTLASNALAEQGGGIPLMSWYRVQKEIMGLTDAEIGDMLNQMRLETALANELRLTNQIIKKTGLFNKTDRIYGEIGAEYNMNQMNDEGDNIFGGGGGSMMGGDLGGDFGGDMGDLGEPGSEDMGDIGGDEEITPLGGEETKGQQPLQESMPKGNHIPNKKIFDEYVNSILKSREYENNKRPSITDKGLLINEELMSKLGELQKLNEISENKENNDVTNN